MAKTITDSNFDTEVLQSDKLSVVDFWATWCGPCKTVIGPIIDSLSKELGDMVNIGKVNADENQDLCVRYGVISVPCVLFIKNGEVVDKQVGAAPKNVFDKKIKKLLG